MHQAAQAQTIGLQSLGHDQRSLKHGQLGHLSQQLVGLTQHLVGDKPASVRTAIEARPKLCSLTYNPQRHRHNTNRALLPNRSLEQSPLNHLTAQLTNQHSRDQGYNKQTMTKQTRLKNNPFNTRHKRSTPIDQTNRCGFGL